MEVNNFPFLFWNLVFRKENLFLRENHFCLESYVSRIYYFHFCLYEHSCLHRWSECIWKCVRHRKIAHCRMCFFTGISNIVARDDCCAGIAIKCCSLFSVKFSLCYFIISKHKDWEVFLHLQLQHWWNLSMQMPIPMFIHYLGSKS